MEETNHIRELLLTPQFEDYFNAQEQRIKDKFGYVMDVLMTQKVINTKFVKKIINSNLYEMRVSVGSNEHRTLMFSIDNENLIEATQILLLNAFLKKSEKDYRKQIIIATNILKEYQDDEAGSQQA